MILNVISNIIETTISESEQYNNAVLELEKLLDSILYDGSGYPRFTRFVTSDGVFFKILLFSSNFVSDLKEIRSYSKIRVGFYRSIPIFVDTMQEDFIIYFKNSKKRIRENRVDQIIENSNPIPTNYVFDLRTLIQSSSKSVSPVDTKE